MKVYVVNLCGDMQLAHKVFGTLPFDNLLKYNAGQDVVVVQELYELIVS